MSGILYIVATPIGNLDDMSLRAVQVLKQVEWIAAEDTRHTGKLLAHFGITTRTISLHEHNEEEKVPELVSRLVQGQSLALVSDAGTPLVSDPGFRLVRAAREQDIAVVPVPGPCAAIVALSAAGLPPDRFVFEGFPPARHAARLAYFERLAREERTLVFYESPHRLAESLADMAVAFGREREAVLARELTKKFETIHGDRLGELCDWVAEDENRARGEFVLLVHGAPAEAEREVDAEAERVLRLLLAAMPVKQAAQLAAAITGAKKNALYQRALALTRDADGAGSDA